MAQAAIRPTVTQKVRRFLGEQGVALTPWTGVDDVYAELYALMSRRRDDPAFWPDVSRLLDDIVKDVTDPESPRRLASPHAELLGSWDVKSLVAELRRSLPAGEIKPDRVAVRRFGATLSAHLLGGFLLLGLAAAGCNESDTNDLLPGCAEATGTGWTEGCALDRSTVLWCSIATSSTMDTAAKGSLCGCFAGLNDSWRTGLTSLFETEDAETVADALGEMLTCVCTSQGEYLRDGSFVSPLTTYGPYGGLCDAAPAYKGVSFER